ncbi:MAG: helix-hairpin-helix domain-containing protein [Anaerolineaceae bacterium]|nr:helix-hairpin-helix domain-containing protein [Anaerolineaceae bacterium]MCB9099384.1 helix-hairpin-helix domain-containing protein [Anaerolineales bacterium]
MNSTWLDHHRNLVFGVLSLLAVGGAGIFYWNQPAADPIEILPVEAAAPTATEVVSTPTPTATPAPVRVYVTGAVARSDVYFLPAGSIIKDAIEAAGGFTEEAEPERINQALELQDQQQIHIPRRDEASPPPPVQGGPIVAVAGSRSGSSAPISNTGGIINLNTATLEQLDSLPGVGPAIAQRILDYRDSVGGFSSIEEITQVSGIGPATFDKIKALITVN